MWKRERSCAARQPSEAVGTASDRPRRPETLPALVDARQCNDLVAAGTQNLHED